MGRIRLGVACLLTALIAAPAAMAKPAGTMIETMRARDRFGPPEAELAAWQAFAKGTDADSQASPALRAEALTGLAIAQYYMQDYAGADATIDRATAVAGDQLMALPFAHELLAYHSLISGERGQRDEAGKLAEQALQAAIGHHGEDSAAAALAHNALALHVFTMGDTNRAAKEMCEAARLARAHLPPTDGMVTNNMSSCAAILYYTDQQAAIPVFTETATFAFANLPPDSSRLALVLNNTAGVLSLLGRWSEVEDIARKSVDAYRRALGPDNSDQVNAMSLLGRALAEQGKLEEAEAILRETAAMADRFPRPTDPTRQGDTKVTLASLLARTGELAAARDWAMRGLADLERDGPSPADSASARRLLADLLARDGKLDEALAGIRQARSTLQAKFGEAHRETMAATLTEAAILARANRAQEGLALGRPVAEALATRLGDMAATRSERVALAPTMRAGFGSMAHVALAAGNKELGLRYAQYATLSELAMADAQLAAAAGARDPAARALMDDIRERQRAARRFESAIAEDSTDLAERARAQAENAAELARLEARFASEFPAEAALARPTVETLAAIEARLGEREALVIPMSLADRVLTLAVTRSGLRWSETPVPAHEFAALAKRLAQSLDPNALAVFDGEAAHRLHSAVFPAELWQALSDIRLLRFPANGPLAGVPPSVLLTAPYDPAHLPKDQAWLLRDKATMIDAPARLEREARGKALLGLGAPLADDPAMRTSGLEPLPGAARELAALTRGWRGKARILTGAQASEAAVRQIDFAPFAVVAFATHGLLAGDMPGLDEPALVLGRGLALDGGDDGLLTASEIATMSIPAEWAILSACNSGAGARRGASDFSGLARAFRLAGTRSMLVSQWEVRDDAARWIAIRTLRGAKGGKPRAEALRQAQLALIRDPRMADAGNPSVWGPFVLVGD